MFPLAAFRRIVDINLVGTFNVLLRLGAERIAKTRPIGKSAARHRALPPRWRHSAVRSAGRYSRRQGRRSWHDPADRPRSGQ